jgi:hypothetical protein
MGDIITKWGGELLTGSVLAVGGYVFRLAYRIEVMERLFKDKKQTLDGVVTASADHEKRLAVIESVIVDLRELTPALQNVATKVETLLETSLQRIDRLEERVFTK